MSFRRQSRPDTSSIPTIVETPATRPAHTECIVLLQRALNDLFAHDQKGQLTIQMIRHYLQELRKRP